MGCYGIGLGRCMAAIVEQNNDDKGIIWPISVAPFKCSIVIANVKDEVQVNLANNFILSSFRIFCNYYILSQKAYMKLEVLKMFE